MRFALAVTLSAALLLTAGCKGDPSTAEYWDKALDAGKKHKDKVKVVEELRSKNPKPTGILEVLHKHLASEKSGETKAAIARLLGEMKDPASVGPLTDAIAPGASDSDEKAMNKEIAVALGNIGDLKAGPALRKLLSSKDGFTQVAAIEALGELKDKDSFDGLYKLATDEATEPFINKKAIQAVGELADARAVPGLTRMMFKERRGVSFYLEASYALYQIGPASADGLLAALEGKDQELAKWAQEAGIIDAALAAKAAQVLGDLHENRAEKTLIEKLKFDHPALDIKLFVRLRAADALGRMRSKDAAKALAGMLDEPEATARGEYCRALVKIGAKDQVPALVKAAGKGSWDARDGALIAVALLGEERDLAAYEKFKKDEEGLTRAECKEDDMVKGCKDPDSLVKQHLATLGAYQKALEAAKECKADGACWTKKLDDGSEWVRTRAAYELGRSGKADAAGALTKKLTDSNLESRLAVIQSLSWLIHDSKDAAAKAKEALPALEKQIAEEKGKTEFVKVNEDLRRLAVLMRRS